MERDEIGYSGGRPVWFIVLIIFVMFLIIIVYGYTKFLPDLTNWIKGGDPDHIQWLREAPGK